MLHAYRLENQHFNSTDEESETFFKDIVIEQRKKEEKLKKS